MDTAQLQPEPGTVPPKHYVWEVPGKRLTIHVDFTVIDRLVQEVMRGFGAIPRRGAEVGGVLLGSAEVGDRIIVRIEDFEVVHCEHRRGPSYLLSDSDVARFAETIARHRFTPQKTVYAVGCYRSHTRDGLCLTPEDLSQFDAYFPDVSDVFLLIKPYATKVSQAGFFFREEDGIRVDSSYLEFPFRRKELGGGATPGVRARELGPVAHTVSNPAAAPASYPVIPRLFETEAPAAETAEESADPIAAPSFGQPMEDLPRRRNVWIPLSFIFLLVGVLVGFQASLTYRPAKAAGIVGDAYQLSLTAGKSGDYVLVRWDRNAPAIKGALRGVLRINDGGREKEVDLDALQLQNPQVFYRNLSPKVTFKLEVFTKERISLSETTEWGQ
ncbi:MAG: hypothetical protein JST93_10295 [Acidobacteria bacterium]|nr:hypothetical protein [Acidobacteriota bacterium]